jgi:multimeric flavodoxin WrbA
MKIIGINSSPIKGSNTEAALKAVLEGARSRGAAVELVRLYDLDVAPCDGCDACLSGGGCVIDDEGKALMERVEAAQAVVFATPIYWYAVSGVLKNLIDRTYYAYHHKAMAGKRVVALMVQHSSGADEALSLFKHWVADQGCVSLEPVTINTESRQGVVAGDAGLLRRLHELGERLAS